MRVKAFLRFVAEIKGVSGRDVKKAVEKVIGLCGLEDVQDRISGNLSKGYRQRVGLAQSMVNDPEILILDEPTSGLDPEQVYEIRNLIKSLAGKRTVILSSHILPEVAMVCQRVIIINHGQIAAVGTPDELESKLRQNLSLSVRMEGPVSDVASSLKKIGCVIDVSLKEISHDVADYLIEAENNSGIHKDLVRVAYENQWIIYEMRPKRMNLEEIFLKIVTKEG